MRGGWKSTKLHLALISMALITGAYALIGFPKDQFATFGGLLLAAAGIYSTANTVTKFSKPS
jgi:hypothetical protein